jgi:hypothetical protein
MLTLILSFQFDVRKIFINSGRTDAEITALLFSLDNDIEIPKKIRGQVVKILGTYAYAHFGV